MQSFLTPDSKLASPKQNKTTPCIYFHHLFRNRVSLLQKISSQNLSVLPVSSQVSSVMVPAVSLDSLGLWQKLGGKDQESESGRGGAPKQTHSRRSRSRGFSLGSLGNCLWEGMRVWVCAPTARLYHGRKGVICHQAMIFCSGLTISDYRVVSTTAEFNKFVKVTLKELLPLCLNACKPMGSWKADTSSSGCTEVDSYWRWANKWFWEASSFLTDKKISLIWK